MRLYTPLLTSLSLIHCHFPSPHFVLQTGSIQFRSIVSQTALVIHILLSSLSHRESTTPPFSRVYIPSRPVLSTTSSTWVKLVKDLIQVWSRSIFFLLWNAIMNVNDENKYLSSWRIFDLFVERGFLKMNSWIDWRRFGKWRREKDRRRRKTTEKRKSGWNEWISSTWGWKGVKRDGQNERVHHHLFVSTRPRCNLQTLFPLKGWEWERIDWKVTSLYTS